MAKIDKCATLIKRVALTNLGVTEGQAITPMISGRHGIGKSQIIKQAASALGGYAFVVEGGSLKEGEITGLPFAQQNADGSSEVRFIKYNKVNTLWQLEKFYYEKALNAGFKIDDKTILKAKVENENFITYLDKSGKEEILEVLPLGADAIIRGEDNRYKFGENLPFELKLKLIENGEIKPVLFFIDELNRTENQTQKELMNIILNRSVNGYDLPWWSSVVSAVNPSSQNSSYATNEMDPAQMDRFLKINATPDLEGWVDHELDRGRDADLLSAVAAAPDIFVAKDTSLEDNDEMSPSPRSWDMVFDLLHYSQEINSTKFFTPEEKKDLDHDLRVLIAGKVGPTASNVMLQNLKDKDNLIKPADIITGKDKKIDDKVLQKFSGQKAVRRKITCDSVVRYLCENMAAAEKAAKGADKNAKDKYENMLSQIKQFFSLLDDAIKISVVKKTITAKCVNDTRPLYTLISKTFSADMLQKLSEFKNNVDNLGK